MTAPVATIVLCSDLVHHVYSTLVSVERQTHRSSEIVLCVDPATPRSAHPWLSALARHRGCSFVQSETRSPGAIRNAAVTATTAPYLICLDAGDLLPPRFQEAGVAALSGRPTAAIASSSVRMIHLDGRSQTLDSPGSDLSAAVASPDAIHGASMFRRDVWIASGGFDETLPTLEDYEFWLRVLGDGLECVWVEQPLVRALRRDSWWYRRRDPEEYVAAMTSIYLKHRELVERHMADLFYARERRRMESGDTYRRLLANRDDAVAELERLDIRGIELTGALSPAADQGPAFEDMHRASPVDRNWGYGRGTPLDRYYIEKFLEAHEQSVTGVVLEVQEPMYTRRFGGERVTRGDVVDLDPGNTRATIVSDLRDAANIPSESYDCVILTQTIHVINEMTAVAAECYRILRPGGVLLATLPCASRVCVEYGPNGDFWRVTPAGARTLFEPFFPWDGLEIRPYGNLLANAAFLFGLAGHELTEDELDREDPFYPMLIGVHARKETTGAALSPPRRPVRAATSLDRANSEATQAAVLLYHRVQDADLGTDVHGLSVSPAAFRTQMAYLATHCHPVPLRTLVGLARKGALPARAVAVTFDDGYMDNYTVACPILEAMDIPATFFVTTGHLEEPHEFWWDVLAGALVSARSAWPGELRIELPDGPHTFATRTQAERLAAHWRIYHAIVASPASVRDQVVDTLRRWSGTSLTDHAFRRMDADTLCALAARKGHTIGAHTVRHEMLPRQPLAAQRDEIVGSRSTLERLLGRRISMFAYPFGAWSRETEYEVGAAAFDIAVTCGETPVGSGVDALRVPRLEASQLGNHFEGRLEAVFGKSQ